MNLTLRLGDSFEEIPKLQGVGAVVTDPPYGLEFMGEDWDRLDGTANGFRRAANEADVGRDNPFGRASRTSPEYMAGHPMQVWHQGWLAACFDALPPGGTIKVFSATRTFHRLAAAMEQVGFVGIDIEAWAYGSGFPKSLNVSKAMDAHAGEAEYFDLVRHHLRYWRDKRGLTNKDLNIAVGSATTGSGMARHWTATTGTQHTVPAKGQWAKLKAVLKWPDCELDSVYDFVKDGAKRPGTGEFRQLPKGCCFSSALYQDDPGTVTQEVTLSATEQAKRFEGWGTALKPAWEPFIVARKP
jgi:hypothetical protein